MKLKKLPEGRKDEEKVFAQVGRKLLDVEKLIVSDIDHTLLGDDNALKEFIQHLENTESKVGFAVATGRTVDSAFDVLKENNVPYPDIIISSVGAEIYYNYQGKINLFDRLGSTYKASVEQGKN